MKNKLVKTLIFVVTLTLILGTISVYNPKTVRAADSWTTGLVGGTARDAASGAAYNGNIYFWGGGDDVAVSNKMDIYNIAGNSWSTGLAGGTARTGQASAIYNGKIYYWGGKDAGGTTLNTIDIYNVSSNSWSTGLAGGIARFWHSAAGSEGKIYFWGGCTGAVSCSVYLNSVSIYDIASNTWSTGLSGGTARFGQTSVVHEGKIYSWGGVNASTDQINSLDIYNIASNSWSTGLSGGTARNGHISAVYDGKIYSWGGEDAEGGMFNTMYIYDIAENTWSSGTTGGSARYTAASAMSDGKIYYWAGYDADWNHFNTMDIYDTGVHPNPTFETLPGDTREINLTEGQNVTTSSYTLQVNPYSPNGITDVKFYVDNNLICTNTTADADGIYSCDWDTTLYHSDVRVVATDPFARSAEITRTTTVVLPATTNTEEATVLPETGADLFLTP